MRGYSGSTEREELMKIRGARYNPAPSMASSPSTPACLTTLALIAVAAGAAVAVGAAADATRRFDADAVGRPPAGFTFHVSRHSAPSHWLVEREQANGLLAHRGESAGHAGFALALL
jgi:hypothetical protein